MRTVCGIFLAALAAGCASTPPAPAMALTPVPCTAGPDPYPAACGGEVPDYYSGYGTPYTYYPVFVPVYPIVVTLPPPVKPTPPPVPPPSPPPPKIHRPAPRERPCPKGAAICP